MISLRTIRNASKRSYRKAIILFLLPLLISFGIILIVSCSQTQTLPVSIKLSSHNLDNISIFWTADITGNLEPCGCRGGQMGGLPKQAQWILQTRKKSGLLLDAGNLMAPLTRYHEYFKWYYILLIYDKIGYDAVNLGRNESRLSSSQIKTVLKKVYLPIVSCNVLDASSQSPLVSPYLIKDIQGFRIAITGLAEPLADAGEGIAFLSPQEALSKYLPEMSSQSNMIILLSNLSSQTVSSIASQFPQIHLILNTGDTGTFSPRQLGGTMAISSLTSQGRYLQNVLLDFRQSGEMAWIVGRDIRLGSDISDHPGTVHLLQKYRDELSEKRFYLYNLSKDEKKLAGASRCSVCHSKEYKKWKETSHSRSLASLKQRKNERNPRCLPCHITGFGVDAGFVGEEKTPDLAFVGCEVCHGPSLEHNDHSDSNTLAPSPSNPNPKQKCLECHTWEHCEKFDFHSFWEKIKH